MLGIHSVLCVIPNWRNKYVENDTLSFKFSKSNFENFWKQINTSLTGDQCRWKSEITHNLPTQTIQLQQLQARRNPLKSDDKKHTYRLTEKLNFTEQEVELF